MTLPKLYFVFDVESVGLHGEGFAVGWCLLDTDGTEVGTGFFACHPSKAQGTDAGRKWVGENCPLAAMPFNCENPSQVRNHFWNRWLSEKENGAVMFADCAWPVEARFLSQCVADNPTQREWEGPYPLHEIASVLLANGIDPLAKHDRLSYELPEHDPLADARQSGRILLECLIGSKSFALD